ncbi:MAG: Hsp70 family protein [Deltaproteobacteria bacterium]|nr:Hsp70 family protein [Deltaproteobacteria bacterium]
MTIENFFRDNSGIARTSAVEQRDAALKYLRSLPESSDRAEDFKSAYAYIRNISDAEEMRNALIELAITMPKHGPCMDLFKEVFPGAINSTDAIPEPIHRKSTLTRLVDCVPDKPEYAEAYARVVEKYIEAADKIDDRFARRYALAEIASRLKHRDEYEALMLHAMKVSLGFAGLPGFRQYSLPEIARELPKSCDVEVYRNHTFLGLAFSLPHRGEFLELFKKALTTAIESTEHIVEPYYKKYALLFMANRLPETAEFLPLRKSAFRAALASVDTLADSFARQYGYNEFLKDVPKTREFSDILLDTVEKSLPFFSLRSQMSDYEPIEILDRILIVADKKISDSKKKHYTRFHYADFFLKQLNLIADNLNDVRLLEILRPYTHVWVRPKTFRDSIRKVFDKVSSLKGRYHGAEVERPLYVSEACLGIDKRSRTASVMADTREGYALSIDLGATNTVVMLKKPGAFPEFVNIEGLSETIGSVAFISTAVDKNNDLIGAAAPAQSRSNNIKKLFMEGDEEGRELIEKFFRILYSRIKESVEVPGFFKKLSGRIFDTVSVTVPVGYTDYSGELTRIIEKYAGSARIKLVEEPLAAAIGYNVAEKKEKFVLVLDFGGCTLDPMLLRLSTDMTHVIAKPDRSKMLGGRDIDRWVAEYVNEKHNLRTNPSGHEALTAAEALKIELSAKNSAKFVFGGRDIAELTRIEFEELLSRRGFYSDIDRELSNVLKKASKLGVYKSMIEAVIITGGSSQIPSFKEKISHYFHNLAVQNAIYDHSPLSSVARGAALYGTASVLDRHLAMAYAIKHIAREEEKQFAYEIVLEKGESLPFKKTLRFTPAMTLGGQKEIFLELFEVPDSLIVRRWISEGGMEFIKQILKHTPDELDLRAFKTVTLSFDAPIEGSTDITFIVEENGRLKVRYEKDGRELATDIHLQ